MERIVSLLPSLTEIACALGFEAQLVGRSHECDHPAGVASLPACTAPRFDPEGSSREIDDRVRRLVREGLSVYHVDAELLRELAPDAILTQDHCEVCAASLGDVEDALTAWLGARPRVVSVSPSSLSDVWASIGEVASALGAAERGRVLVEALTERLTTVGETSGGLTARPRVACVEWIEPLMAAGNWVPELVALAGGRALFGTAGEDSPWLEWDVLRAADPEVLVVMPCGFDRARTRAELDRLAVLPGFTGLAAVREGRVFVVDGNQYFNRPGPRLADSLEILAEILHPEVFSFGHEGRGWERARI